MASINKVIIMGNLTADPEFKTTPSGVSVTTFSVAVGRKFAKSDDEVKADFFNVVAWRGLAEFVSKYFTKGKSIVVIGSLQNRSYTTQNGEKRYITEIIADECTFAGSSQNDGQNGIQRASQPMEQQITPNFEEISQEDELLF